MQEEILISKKISKRKLWTSRVKRRLFKHVWVLRAALFLIGVTGVYLTILLIGLVVKKTQIPFYFGLARDFIFISDDNVKSFEGNTNIILLGKGGKNHKASDLTDTIIFTSISHSNFSISLISIPRDIWIPELRAKLNSTYYWGNQKKEGGGLILAKSTVEQIVGEPVHYALVVDFEGFKHVIDVLESVEVEVERTFVDEKYPIVGREDDECDGDIEFKCRYETVKFEMGIRTMDGDTALKFVRSRNAEGDEGTDFARAERQQKVINAIKERVLSSEILFSPKKLIELKNVLLEYSESDIDSTAAASLSRRILQSRNNVSSHLLAEELLENPPKSPRYDNLYVFIPKTEDPLSGSGQVWSRVHEWVGCVLEGKEICIK